MNIMYARHLNEGAESCLVVLLEHRLRLFEALLLGDRIGAGGNEGT